MTPRDKHEPRDTIPSTLDSKGMFEIQERFPENFADTLESYRDFSLPKEVKSSSGSSIKYGPPANMVIAGLGGSAIGGDLLRRWQYRRLKVPLEVSRGYELPGYADNRTLVIVVSYSGETEETLSCFMEAVRKMCMIVGVASEGRLIRYCGRLGYPLLRVPAGYPPRSAFPFLFAALITILDRVGLLKHHQDEVEEALAVLKKIRDKTRRSVPSERNLAKKLAAELRGTMPVIYADRMFGEVALRWKTQINENRKIHAKVEVFPELNHNEMVGWEGITHSSRRFSVIILRDSEEEEAMRVRIDVSRDILKERGVKVMELYPEGESLLAKLMYFIYLGDMMSLYSAIDAAIDPFETTTISRVKHTLEERVNLQSKLDREVDKITKAR